MSKFIGKTPLQDMKVVEKKSGSTYEVKVDVASNLKVPHRK